jgi:hypothetical protein
LSPSGGLTFAVESQQPSQQPSWPLFADKVAAVAVAVIVTVLAAIAVAVVATVAVAVVSSSTVVVAR